MSVDSVHITNGDALTGRLRHLNMGGKILTMRELMIDGPVTASEGWESFFKSREAYVNREFVSALSYDNYVLSEFIKMRQIDTSSIIFFWFEDDLFCQANWWFLMYYLRANDVTKFLVRSGDDSPYSFGDLSDEQVQVAFNNKIQLKEAVLTQLWNVYITQDQEGFNTLNKKLIKKYPFIQKAFEAHMARIPTAHYLGRPKELLKKISKEMTSSSFSDIYKVFAKEAAVYGYGDLQVQHMLAEIT